MSKPKILTDIESNKSDIDSLIARIGNNEELNTEEKTQIILALNEVNNKATNTQQSLTTHLDDKVSDVGGVHGLEVEQGVFTPYFEPQNGSFGNVVYNEQVGWYRLTNDMLFFQLYMNCNITDLGSASGDVLVMGLPYFPSLTGANYYACRLRRWDFNTEPVFSTLHVVGDGSARIDITKPNGETSRAQISDLSNNKPTASYNNISVNGFYKI